ncbi:MAG TPA: hypothetical protein PKZ82_15415 [Microthrixaceae bacterium]|nr:hypothetical protein [Microthrixaceae bacterium]HNG25145.1 hypothetical protein [Microthrixaceae bacterium]
MQPQIRSLPPMSPPQAYWRGTVTALVVALPAGVMNQVLVSGGDIDPGSPWTFLFWILIMLGGAAGGWAVRRLAPGSHLAWAAGAAATAYVVVQAIGVIRRLVTGDPISWIAYPFLALLMATCGVMGAAYAGRMTRRYGEGEQG